MNLILKNEIYYKRRFIPGMGFWEEQTTIRQSVGQIADLTRNSFPSFFWEGGIPILFWIWVESILSILTRNNFRELFWRVEFFTLFWIYDSKRFAVGGEYVHFEKHLTIESFWHMFPKPADCQKIIAQFLQSRVECMLSQTASHGQTGKTYKKCFLQCFLNFLAILSGDERKGVKSSNDHPDCRNYIQSSPHCSTCPSHPPSSWSLSSLLCLIIVTIIVRRVYLSQSPCDPS